MVAAGDRGSVHELHDDRGMYFGASGPEQVQSDGSVVKHYVLPAGGTFDFEIGWFCTAFDADEDIPLAQARFHTAP